MNHLTSMNIVSGNRNSHLLSTTVRITEQTNKKTYLLLSVRRNKTKTAGSIATQFVFQNRQYLQHWNELGVTKQKTYMYEGRSIIYLPE